MFFLPFFKYHDVFQDPSKDYISKDDITGMTEVIALYVCCAQSFITECAVKISFPLHCRFSFLRILRFILTKERII